MLHLFKSPKNSPSSLRQPLAIVGLPLYLPRKNRRGTSSVAAAYPPGVAPFALDGLSCPNENLVKREPSPYAPCNYRKCICIYIYVLYRMLLVPIFSCHLGVMCWNIFIYSLFMTGTPGRPFLHSNQVHLHRRWSISHRGILR